MNIGDENKKEQLELVTESEENLSEHKVLMDSTREKLFYKYQNVLANLFCHGQPYDRFLKPGMTIDECLPLLIEEFERTVAERDALRLRNLLGEKRC